MVLCPTLISSMDLENLVHLPPSILVLSFAVVFVAGFVRGYLGFGFSSILMVALLPFIPATQLVPFSVALEILASSSQAPRILPDVNRRYLAILLAASAVGVPGGVYLLSVFPEEWLRLLVYGVIFLSTSVVLASKTRSIAMTAPSLLVAGMIAGAVNGATALSGLVLALFFASSTVPSRTMRATLIAYLFFTDMITAVFLLVSNHFDAATIYRVAFVAPFMIIGVWLGSSQFLRTPSTVFKTLVRWLLLGFCVLGILQLL